MAETPGKLRKNRRSSGKLRKVTLRTLTDPKLIHQDARVKLMIENPDDMRGQRATNLKHPGDQEPHPGRWAIAIMVSAAIVLSYLDRLTLPWTLSEIQKDYPFSDQVKALFDSAFLISYGLMYLGGGQQLDIQPQTS